MTPAKPDLLGGLTKAAGEYAVARVSQSVSNLGDRASGGGSGGGSKEQDGGEDKQGFLGATAQKLGEGASPVKAVLGGVGTSIKEGVKGLFSRKGGSKRPHNIVEDVIVGVTPDVCFAAFTQWEEFPSFMKGPTSVTRGEETPEDQLEEDQHPLEGEQTNWNAKIFMSKRSWKATTVDYDPPNRLSWTSEGSKGTVDGTITFTAIGDNATLIALELEYRSKGPVEWMGQRWHTVGKRARLDLKHFRRYVMRTEPDDLPEPEEADEIPEEAQAQDQGEERDSSDDQSQSDGEEQSDDSTDEESDEEDQSDEEEESSDEPEEAPKRVPRSKR